MYYLDEFENRIYTLKRNAPDGRQTISAHPARFSQHDRFSKERITLKKRLGLLTGKKYSF